MFDISIIRTRAFRMAALLVGTTSLAMAQAAAVQTSGYAARGARVIQELSVDRFDTVVAQFDAHMIKEFPQTELLAQWNELRRQAGPFVKVKNICVTPELGGYHTVTMTCAFQRALEGNAQVTFDNAGRIAGLYFGPQPTQQTGWVAPSYAIGDRFHEVAVGVEDGPWRLPGTLTIPNGSGLFPAVLLVPGSPPLDQDSTSGSGKLFKDIAWGLASRDIVVLRYTKRTHQFGAGLGGGPLSSFTLREELTDDAHAAIALLERRSEVDRRRIYLLGHSMGGVVAPKIAATDPMIAGVIIMGAAAQNDLTVLIEREKDSAVQGADAATQAANTIPVFEKLRDGKIARGATVNLYGQRSPANYWEEIRDYAPGAATAKLKIPALVMVGGHDAEAPPDNFEAWKSALAGRADTVKFYPGLFHLFMPSTSSQKGRDAPDDWTRAGHVAPEVVNDIASWISSQGR